MDRPEVADAKGKKNARGEIVEPLFERAVTDVPGAVTLWLGYFEFSMDQDWESAPVAAPLYERAPSRAGADFRDGSKLFAARARGRPPGTPWTATPARRWRVACAISSDASSRSRTRASRRPRGRRRRGSCGDEVEKASAKNRNESAGESLRAGADLTPAARAAYAVAVAVTERRRPLEEAIAAAEALPCGDDRRTGTPSAEASAGETDEKRQKKPPPPRAREARTDALASAHRAFVAAEEYAFETDGGSAEAQEVHLCRTRG